MWGDKAGVVFGSGLDTRFRGLVAGGAGKVGALPYPRLPHCRFSEVAVLCGCETLGQQLLVILFGHVIHVEAGTVDRFQVHLILDGFFPLVAYQLRV